MNPQHNLAEILYDGKSPILLDIHVENRRSQAVTAELETIIAAPELSLKINPSIFFISPSKEKIIMTRILFQGKVPREGEPSLIVNCKTQDGQLATIAFPKFVLKSDCLALPKILGLMITIRASYTYCSLIQLYNELNF